MELKFKGFEGDNAYSIADQINGWTKDKNDIEILDIKITSNSYISGSPNYIHSESRTHALVIYKIRSKEVECPEIKIGWTGSF